MPEPERRELVWHFGAVDGEPAPVPAHPPFNVPPPVWTERQDRRDKLRRNMRQDGRHARDERRRDDKKEDKREDRRRNQPRYKNDHPAYGWERHHRRDEHDDDGSNPGGHGHQARSFRGAKGVAQEPVSRERDRSPPRRHWGSERGDRRREASPPNQMPAVRDLQAEHDAELRFLFKAQAASILDVANNLLKNHSVRLNHKLVIPAMEDYICKAVKLADRLGISDELGPSVQLQVGDEALSGDHGRPVHAQQDRDVALVDVPVALAYQRLKRSLLFDQEDVFDMDTREQLSAVLDRMQAAATRATARHLQAVCNEGQLVSPRSPSGRHATSRDGEPDNIGLGLDVFFATPPPPAIQAQPAPLRQVQTRRRKTYDMSKVRRSARLARKPAMPAMKKAQVNLCRQLGLADEDRVPIEQTVIEYIQMYKGHLPQDIVAAMSTFFGIHDEFVVQLDEAMMELAGVGIDDVQEVINDNDV
ncbi:unnamed protein product [Urochloa humidicola]